MKGCLQLAQNALILKDFNVYFENFLGVMPDLLFLVGATAPFLRPHPTMYTLKPLVSYLHTTNNVIIRPPDGPSRRRRYRYYPGYIFLSFSCMGYHPN